MSLYISLVRKFVLTKPILGRKPTALRLMLHIREIFCYVLLYFSGQLICFTQTYPWEKTHGIKVDATTCRACAFSVLVLSEPKYLISW